MRKIWLFLLLFLFLTVFCFAVAEQFEYRFVVGTKYRILSEVDENVYINSVLSHHARMLNRISVEIIEADHESGVMFATLDLSERITGRFSTYEITERYESTFRQDRRGFTTVDRQYFIPMARDIPVFPDYPIEPGYEWTGEGEEVHDFRRSFNIPQPYAFPVSVSYKYLGKDETGLYDVFNIRYSVDHETNFPRPRNVTNQLHLVRITGSTDQIMLWDNKRGRAFSYSEEFIFEMELLSGDIVTFTGTAWAEVIEAEDLDTDKLVEEVEQSIRDSGIENVYVERVAEGIKITIEDIQFLPDSAILAETEFEKLAQIIEILHNNPNHDLLIIGHTALAGTAEGRRALSFQRARGVAEHILDSGARTEREVRILGRGAEEPVATNATEEGRRRNRRVEIIILEN
ncbi:MAG: OmpA family protein [Spirochaetaceae bacterium]|nr:OmpA family protein [Spirochaetaceae bacterium]